MRRFLIAVARLVILLFACGAVFWFGHWFVLRGQEMRNARHENTLLGLQREVNEGRAAKRTVPLFREEVERLELEAEKLEADELPSDLPAGGGLPELLSEIRRICRASGVTLERQEPTASGDDGSEIGAHITVRGRGRQMLAFFAALGDDPYPFAADDLRLSPDTGTTGVLQADLFVASLRSPRPR